MEKHIVLKPYKRSLQDWKNNPDDSREEDGKVIFRVDIGKKLVMDEEKKTVVSENALAEDIYLNILQDIFSQNSSYRVVATLGYEPQLVISYDGRLVAHNDKIDGYVAMVMEALKKSKYEADIKVLINYVLNETVGAKYSSTLKRLQTGINTMCKTNFPPEFIGLVVKNYICDYKRSADESNEYPYMDYESLMEEAGKVMVSINKGALTIENKLVEELLYRFVQGTLIPRE